MRREPCDCRDCVDGPDAQPLPGQKHAAALLDPPPKCVVVLADGFLALSSGDAKDASRRGDEASEPVSAGRRAPQDTLQVAACPHLHRLAQDGCSGFVALPRSTGAAPCLLLLLFTAQERSQLSHIHAMSMHCRAGTPVHGVEALQLLFGGGAVPANAVRTAGSIADRCSHILAMTSCNPFLC